MKQGEEKVDCGGAEKTNPNKTQQEQVFPEGMENYYHGRRVQAEITFHPDGQIAKVLIGDPLSEEC